MGRRRPRTRHSKVVNLQKGPKLVTHTLPSHKKGTTFSHFRLCGDKQKLSPGCFARENIRIGSAVAALVQIQETKKGLLENRFTGPSNLSSIIFSSLFSPDRVHFTFLPSPSEISMMSPSIFLPPEIALRRRRFAGRGECLFAVR